MNMREIRQAYKERLDEIRADRTLSALGRRTKIRALFSETERRIAKLRAEHEAELREQRQRLLRRAFGAYVPGWATPSEIRQIQADYRQALDRAEQAANPTEALALLQRADLAGDRSLARALGLVAAERHWDGVLDAVTNLGGVHPDAIRELREHLKLDSPEAKFQRRMAFAAPDRPQELN